MSVIQKLSLTDASKESSESVMIGREKEQNNILSFLKSAICGGSEETGSSMFVAGPPGTGKSGSVRAAIANLQREQASGLIPPFRFVSLNGMEMRHPFEAYIRLLEALKGGTKIRKSEEEATAWLEKYFTTTAHLTEDEEELVTVVLLDEIDYLVTQKQTVMYNFFDWPRRSASLFAAEGRGRRLVVIGVSNTLNLPERLQPRVQSRIGNRRCYFKSYNVKEIQSILQAKVNQASPVRVMG
jgi:origin recognition complex subunit 1